MKRLCNNCGNINTKLTCAKCGWETKTKWVSTTIKRKWMDKILSGEKTIEYKGATEFWNTRLNKLLYCGEEISINFLCGRVSYKFKVIRIFYYDNDRVIDGVLHKGFFEIHLGEQIT